MHRSIVGISVAVASMLSASGARAGHANATPVVAATTSVAPSPGVKSGATAASPVEDLDSVEKVKALCLATRPIGRVYFEGDPVDRDKAKDNYETERKSAMHKLYRASIPASGFRLGDYNGKESSLDLDLSRSPRALNGALTLAISSDKDITFNVTPSQVKAAAAAMKAGTATMVAYFELSDDQGAVCSGSSAAGVFTISVLPVAFDLRDGMGQLLGREETARADRYRAVLGGYSGTPSASIGAVDGDGFDAGGLAKRLAGLSDPLRKCYVDRLKERPDVGGTVVIGVEVLQDGSVHNVTFIADALRDEPLRKCIYDSVKSLKLTGLTEKPAMFLFRVPVELRLVASR
jgi:hypothetical protein